MPRILAHSWTPISIRVHLETQIKMGFFGQVAISIAFSSQSPTSELNAYLARPISGD
jgi:hypothetical protein